MRTFSWLPHIVTLIEIKSPEKPDPLNFITGAITIFISKKSRLSGHEAVNPDDSLEHLCYFSWLILLA